MKRVAYIHEALTGKYHITDNDLPYLDERGAAYSSKRSAIKAARDGGHYTHRVNNTGKIVKL